MRVQRKACWPNKSCLAPHLQVEAVVGEYNGRRSFLFSMMMKSMLLSRCLGLLRDMWMRGSDMSGDRTPGRRCRRSGGVSTAQSIVQYVHMVA